MSDDNGETANVQATTGQTSPIPEGQGTKAPDKTGPGWLSRVLWLGPRVAEARAKAFDATHPAYVWYDVARQICDDVVKIGETGKGSWAVLILDCTAVELLVRAHLVREGLLVGAAPLTEADWANAQKIVAIESAWGKLASSHAATLTAMLGTEREATLATLSGEERESFAAAVHDLVMRLAEPLEVEANRLGRALFARWFRVGVVALVIAVLIALAGNWIAKKFAKPNLALRKPVVTSSQFPGQGTDHGLLVDGDDDNMGFHTNNDGQQWVVIDLGKAQKVEKIVVYNRADGYEERAVPLKIEVSNDNVTYSQIAERKETFDKWTVKNLKAQGRYIRLKNTPPNYFHLAEVEVY